MIEESIRDLVIKHDTHIDTLANSIEQLAIGVGATNTKLESVIEMMTKQNVIEAKVDNIDKEAKEAFDRVYDSIRDLKLSNEGSGCKTAQQLEKGGELYDEKIKVANNRIANLETETKRIMSPIWIRSIVGVLILQAATFGTYVVQSIHTLDNLLITDGPVLAQQYRSLLSQALVYF